MSRRPRTLPVPAYNEATAPDAETLLNTLGDAFCENHLVMATLGWDGARFYCAANVLLGAGLAEMITVDDEAGVRFENGVLKGHVTSIRRVPQQWEPHRESSASS